MAENNDTQTTVNDASPRECELAELIGHALEKWPNRRWLVLPGPTDIGHNLTQHLARELAAAEAQRVELRPAPRQTLRRQQGGNLTPPCNHREAFIGTVGAGDFRTGPHCSVSTCGPCANRSAGYVELMTGEKAEPLLTFEEARRQADAREKQKRREAASK